ncbi:terminase small subunit [Pelagibacterium luteolum]|uniref:Phage terminase small subunit n=1 Tax=Pelagibacterium luteolum TaxID=440168 RepID=A0A1G7ZHX1_9HYPH|nr:terminase small subunit [Pelagibacterium luteolum]SDH08274.1 phage terminase small subunit [Pelagibacterium luteolum]
MPALSNAKHEAFAQGMAQGMSASEAYVAAGYKESRSAASRLSTNVNIEARIAELIEQGAEKAQTSIERVLAEMSRLGFSDVRKAFTPGGALLPPSEWDEEFAAAVAGIEVVTRPTGERDEKDRPIIEHIHKIKLWDKNSALDKIAKHLGMFVDRIEHSGSVSVTIDRDDAKLL